MKIEILQYLKKFKNTKALLIIFIIGIVLALFPTGSQQEEVNVSKAEDFVTYKEDLEKELESIISKISGAGECDVMVTLENVGSTYFAKDETQSTKRHADETETNTQTNHVLKNEKSTGDAPLITKKTYPDISGVLVCAEGAGNVGVKNSIVKALEALLGIKTHRIEVLERK